MKSVALDVFRMPTVEWEGKKFDTMSVCVDRHSGWIVAIPCQNKGLTGNSLAQAMLMHAWRPFGIPGKITSDQGSQFIGSWWQTMCAKLGIRQAFSQAYHHQANGRAEMAGQQIMEKLRKLNVEENLNWVEALPRVFDRYHDIPGESGQSPYEILFGRERSLGNLPYKPSKECEDAENYFGRMKEIDEKVARILNDKHDRISKAVNAKRKEFPVFEVGQKVWYLRPEGSGEKLDSRWIGPEIITARVGEHSYEIRIKPGMVVQAHASALKAHVEDKVF